MSQIDKNYQESIHEYWTSFVFSSKTLFTHPPHFHDEIEIVFVLDGIFETHYNGVNYTVTGGSVFLAGSNSIHYSTNPTVKSNSVILIVHPKALSGTASQLISKTPTSPIWHNPRKDSIVWPLLKYALEHKQKLSNDDLMLHLSSILSIIVGDMTLIDHTKKAKTENRILQYCRNHYTEEISVSRVSKELNISESHIGHIFSNVMGCTFPQYINTLRLEHAETLLTTTTKSCTHISAQSGFPTLRTFNRVFLQKHNMTPLQFRKQMSKVADEALEYSTAHSNDAISE